MKNSKEVADLINVYTISTTDTHAYEHGHVSEGTPGRPEEISATDSVCLVKMKLVKTWLFVLANVLFIGSLDGQTFDQGRPLIQEIYVPRQLKQAKSVRISCGTIQGELPMVFSWSFNNAPIAAKDPFQRSNFIIRTADTSSDLVIKSLSVDSIGLYSCSSSNKHGTDSQNVSILFEGEIAESSISVISNGSLLI